MRDPASVGRPFTHGVDEHPPNSEPPDQPERFSQPVTDGSLTALESVVTANGPSGTDLQIETASAEGMRSGQLIVRINRILQSDGVVPGSESGHPCLSATWQLPDGTDVRGIIATAQYN